MIRYAVFKSNFTNCVPRPRRRMCCTASSTEAYEMEDSSWEMPSLTLWSLGKERSTIVRHWSTRCDSGTSPIGLVCTSGVSRGWRGPTNLPASVSVVMYSRTAEGLAAADGWFLEADRRVAPCLLKPMRNPVVSPE